MPYDQFGNQISGYGPLLMVPLGLCGIRYMIDSMCAQAICLVLSTMQWELGFGNGETGNLSTAFPSRLTAGAFV